MQRAVFISDVHSNLEALQATLRETRGDEIYCLSDIVGYGASPDEVVEILMDAGARCVMGNHDYAVATGDVSSFSANAARAVLWTRRRASAQTLKFLKSLPLELRFELGGKRFFMAHGSPDDRLWEYVDPWTHSGVFEHYLEKSKSDVIALGHTHVPYRWMESGKVVFNPGSVGQPRSGDWRASYAIVELDGGEVSVKHRLVEYDVEASVAKIFEAGLPRSLGERLRQGF